METKSSNQSVQTHEGQSWLEVVQQHVKSLRYGSVEIVVQDSRVVQIEKTERVRLGKGELVHHGKEEGF